MTTYNYSTITNGQEIAFNAGAGDILVFNNAAISPDSLDLWWLNPDGSDIAIKVWDNQTDTLFKSFTLTGVNLYQMTSANITFSNSPQNLSLVDDNSTGTGDDTTTAGLNGGTGDDLLISFGGSRLLQGGNGNDGFAGIGANAGTSGGFGNDAIIPADSLETLGNSTGNDSTDGGGGFNTLVLYATPGITVFNDIRLDGTASTVDSTNAISIASIQSYGGFGSIPAAWSIVAAHDDYKSVGGVGLEARLGA